MTTNTSPCLWYLSVSGASGRCLSFDDVNRVLEHCGCDDISMVDG